MSNSIQSLTALSSSAQFNLIPRVGIYLHSVFSKKYSLFGRVNLNWRDMVMAVGVATAVAGVCLALFYKMALAAWGFTILSAVQLFAARYVHKYQTLKDLENVVSRLAAFNLDLNQAKLKLEGTAQFLHAENQKLAGVTKNLVTTNENLTNTNRDLTQNNQRLESTVVTLTNTNGDLTQNNQRLENTVVTLTNTNGDLTQNNQRLESTVDTIRNRLLEFGEHNLAFRGQVSGLGTNAQRFQDLYGQFDTSLISMQNLVNTSRQLAEENLRKISEERQQLGDQIKKLEGVVNGNIQLADKLKVLNQYEQKIKDHEEQFQILKLEHTKISTEIQLERIALDKVKEDLRIEVDALQRVRGQLQQDTQSLHHATNQLATQVNQNFTVQIPNPSATVTV